MTRTVWTTGRPAPVDGPIVSVVMGRAGGERCTIQTPDGLLVDGHRVPDDYAPFDHEVVHRGVPVRVRTYDGPGGPLVFDGDVQQKSPTANGWSFVSIESEAGAYRVIEVVEPPPLGGAR